MRVTRESYATARSLKGAEACLLISLRLATTGQANTSMGTMRQQCFSGHAGEPRSRKHLAATSAKTWVVDRQLQDARHALRHKAESEAKLICAMSVISLACRGQVAIQGTRCRNEATGREQEAIQSPSHARLFER